MSKCHFMKKRGCDMSTSKSEIDSFFTDGKIRIDKIRTLDNENYKIEWEIKIIGGKFYARKFIDGKVKSKIKEVTKEWIKERLNIEITL